jgi:hypothetical protein
LAWKLTTNIIVSSRLINIVISKTLFVVTLKLFYCVGLYPIQYPE